MYRRLKNLWGIALLTGVSLTFVAISQAQVKHHPAKCKKGFAAHFMRVPERKHGRLVRVHGKLVYVRVQQCVKVAKPTPKPPPPVTPPTTSTPDTGGPPPAPPSPPSPPPPPPPAPPANTALPQITGGGHPGQAMTATPGTWTGVQPMSFAYQWLRCDPSTGCATIANATSSAYTVQDSDVGKTLSVTVTATDPGGSVAAASAATNPIKYFVVVAVGDIACQPPSESSLSTGPTPGPNTTTATTCQEQATADLAAAQHPDAVLMLGDGQYWNGTLSEYNAVYDSTWGVFNPIVYPVPGNHDYGLSSTASGYFSYFGAVANPMNTPEGYYSFNLGSWHFDALNSNCDPNCVDTVMGGTPSGSAQVSWLQSDLSAHPSACTLAFWHHPYFSAGDIGNNPDDAPFWSALYAAHADVVLNGHDHLYERYPQLDPSGNGASNGLREFVVGTGGEDLVGFYPSHVTTPPGPPTFDDSNFGVLVLTLHASSYDWAFMQTDGTTVDSGHAGCNGSGGAALGARDVRSARPPAALFGPRLRFDARPGRSTLSAATGQGLPVAIHCSRGCDVSVRVSVRRAGRLVRVASFYETESQLTKPNSVIYLRLPVGRLAGSKRIRLVLQFAALDSAGHHRTVTRTVALQPG